MAWSSRGSAGVAVITWPSSRTRASGAGGGSSCRLRPAASSQLTQLPGLQWSGVMLPAWSQLPFPRFSALPPSASTSVRSWVRPSAALAFAATFNVRQNVFSAVTRTSHSEAH